MLLRMRHWLQLAQLRANGASDAAALGAKVDALQSKLDAALARITKLDGDVRSAHAIVRSAPFGLSRRFHPSRVRSPTS